MIIKRLALSVCLLAFAGGAAETPGGVDTHPTLNIAMQKASTPSKAEEVLVVSLLNNTDHDLKVWKSVGGIHAEQFYDIVMSDSNGSPAPRTDYGLALESHQVYPSSRILKTLRPGESLNETMDLSKIFVIAKGEGYKIDVSRRDTFGLSKVAHSNSLQISVPVVEANTSR